MTVNKICVVSTSQRIPVLKGQLSLQLVDMVQHRVQASCIVVIIDTDRVWTGKNYFRLVLVTMHSFCLWLWLTRAMHQCIQAASMMVWYGTRGSWGPVGPGWAPCWPRESCYLGSDVAAMDTLNPDRQHLHIYIAMDCVCLLVPNLWNFETFMPHYFVLYNTTLSRVLHWSWFYQKKYG